MQKKITSCHPCRSFVDYRSTYISQQALKHLKCSESSQKWLVLYTKASSEIIMKACDGKGRRDFFMDTRASFRLAAAGSRFFGLADSALSHTWAVLTAGFDWPVTASVGHKLLPVWLSAKIFSYGTSSSSIINKQMLGYHCPAGLDWGRCDAGCASPRYPRSTLSAGH